MAQKNINIGTPNGQNGDFVRDAFSKTEDNFTELYGRVEDIGGLLDGGGYKNEDGTFTWVMYAEDIEGTNMSPIRLTTSNFVGYAFNKPDKEPSTEGEDYIWLPLEVLKGRDGIDGGNGIDGLDGEIGLQGPPGLNGDPTYFHIAYADDADGNGFSQHPFNKKFIGTYSNYIVADSDIPSDYDWIEVKGADGTKGIPGYNAIDGLTYYLHIAYANSEDGIIDFDIVEPEGKEFIGTLVDLIENDSTTPGDYTWSRILNPNGGIDDGTGTFTWIKFTYTPDGTEPLFNTDEGMRYQGFAFKKLVPEESENFADYQWHLIYEDNDVISKTSQLFNDGATGESKYVEFTDLLAPEDNPAIENSYEDITELLAGQGEQTINNIQFVKDATLDPTVSPGGIIYAYYEYLGTTDGDLEDYRKLSEEEILNLIKIDRTSQLVNDGDGTGDKYLQFGDIIPSEDNPAIENSYADTPELIADQANQTINKIQFVEDATDDPTVDEEGVTYAYYEYLGTTVGDLTDYRKLSEQEILDILTISRTSQLINDGDKEEDTDRYALISEISPVATSDASNRGIEWSVVWNGTGYEYLVTVTKYYLDGVLREGLLQQVFPLSASHPTLNRKDTFIIRNDGLGDTIDNDSLVVLEGVPGNPAVEQVLNEDIELKIAVATVYANTAEPPAEEANYEAIYEEGIEWSKIAVADSGAIDLEHTTDPISGTKSIKVTNAPQDARMEFGHPVESQLVRRTDVLMFDIKLDTFWEWKKTKGLTIDLYLANEAGYYFSDRIRIGRVNGLNFDRLNTVDVQTVIVPFSAFPNLLDSNSFRKIIMKLKRLNNEVFKIDNIRLASALNPASTTTITSTAQLLNEGADKSSTYVENKEIGAAAKSNKYVDLDEKPIFKVVENEYADIATLYADQGSQQDTFIQFVTDASGHPDVTSGSAYFEYLGTTNGDESDYRKLTDEESAPINVAFSGDYNDLTNKPTIKAVENSYTTWALCIADQSNQTSGNFQRVDDASGHPTVDSGYAYFEYLGTTVGDHTDYRKLSEEESMDLEPITKTSQLTNDGADATSTYVEHDELSHLALQEPVLSDFIPDTYLPSTTGDFIIKGDYFIPSMVDNINSTDGILVEGHTINYATFINSQELRINLTTSATEGNYDLTLNNGLVVTFLNVLQVVQGTVYEPTSSDWINVVNLDVATIGDASITLHNSQCKGEWTKELDYTKDWSLKLSLRKSSLGALQIGSYNLVADLHERVSGAVVGSFGYLGQGSDLWYTASLTSATYPNQRQFSTKYNINNINDGYIELKYIAGVLTTYTEFGVLIETSAQVLNNNLVFRVDTKYMDVTDIKYIDLSDVSGDLQDFRDRTSDFINDGEDGTDVYVESKDVYSLVAPSDPVLKPNYTLPNITQDIVIQVKDINSATTVSFSTGTINYQNIELNNFGNLIIRANYTSSVTEGNVDMTINNGKESTFINALTVVNGIPYIPQPSEWSGKTFLINTDTPGEAHMTSYDVSSLAVWDKHIDYTKDFSLKLKFQKTPLGAPTNEGPNHILGLYGVTSGNDLAYFGFTGYVRIYDFADNLLTSEIAVFDSNNKSQELEIRWIGGVFRTYLNGVAKGVSPLFFTEDLEVRVDLETIDVTDIVYTDLSVVATPPNYNDNYATKEELKLMAYIVADLPTGVIGDKAYVTDATATTYYSTVVGGGANVVPVFFNGTNWVIN